MNPANVVETDEGEREGGRNNRMAVNVDSVSDRKIEFPGIGDG